MATVLTHAEIYTGQTVIKEGFIRFDQQVLAVGEMDEFHLQAGDEVHDVMGQRIVPGFIDVHSHGGYSFDTMDGDQNKLVAMVEEMTKNEGITSYFATTMTQSPENIAQAMVAAHAAAQANPVIQGVHLEGPFISPVFKGAQPEEYIQVPDVTELARWQELSGGMIKLLTYAPEQAPDTAFEDYCLANGIVLSVGHSNATRAQMKQSKASHVTHLYNAQREFKHREPGVTGHALLEDHLYCEMIADGYHVSPDMIKLAYKLKGPHRIDLVTDSMRAKGQGDGLSELGGQKVIVKDKQARLESGNLAGSVLTFKDAFVNIMQFTGCSIHDAVQMASVNQAREFGLDRKGTLEVGKDADLNVFDIAWNLKATYTLGRQA
ncbi:N-acetylglucosamine-6-phosphate deacetylase [Ligilactobacillus equi]|uniref:N-acetylglucosamine-6-phosphate deacetylase n=1 Tax=Ligilactobacillus equi DSM 15833 = JCM 10991 TaxID=1423740 RepID=A0A0R1TP59_9LACO|nr:N-acetylglucosamine-6-phosphate deacetylase [Ligilactobacillus equi]KRL83213.1 n-acetylglucosamine-6-phosphate deacetylase [Ligilactobacillus equi DSM 15833 = JCM 10991]